MPSWWRGKSKFQSYSNSFDRRKDAESSSSSLNHGSKLSKKDKAKSFDEVICRSNYRYTSDPAMAAFDSDGGRQCHPLPPPISLSPVLPLAGTESFSASASSLSSTGTDEASDLAFNRQSEVADTPRDRGAMHDSWKKQHTAEHEKLSGISFYPRKESQLHNHDIFSNGKYRSSCTVSVEKISHARSRSPGPESRDYRLSMSSIKSRTFFMKAESQPGKQDDLISPHPLPRPPGSPTSSSHSVQSKWKKGKLIGRGTFGHVFLGFNSECGQMCAIKEVKVISDDSNSKECLKQLSQEIALLSQLSHPNIVAYLGSELVEDSIAVYLEYVSGGSIHKLLQEYGPFREPVIRNYTAQILSGLAYLHGRSRVHRDVKGANILVGPNGEVKLADFGMAKHISAHNSMRSFKGSPYWMAPEVIMNTNGYSLSVDIWSLGCTVLEMATSKPPWCQYEGVAAIFKIGNSKDIPEFPSHFSEEGKDFLKLCFQRDPSARPAASQLLEHAFVRDQAAAKVARFNTPRDHFPSLVDGSHAVASELHLRSSTLHDWEHPSRKTTPRYYRLRNPRDPVGTTTMNTSLPVSPCTSPLRSFRHSTWSCFPSPTHPAFGVGAVSGASSKHIQSPIGAMQKFPPSEPV